MAVVDYGHPLEWCSTAVNELGNDIPGSRLGVTVS